MVLVFVRSRWGRFNEHCLLALWTNECRPVALEKLRQRPNAHLYFALCVGEPRVDWRIPINVCLVDDSSGLLFREVMDIPTLASSLSSFPSKTVDHGDKDQSTVETEVKSQETIYPLANFVGSSGVRMNPGPVDFYRVHYDPATMSAIVEAIGRGTVP